VTSAARLGVGGAHGQAGGSRGHDCPHRDETTE
jgi:hypothetical protein